MSRPTTRRLLVVMALVLVPAMAAVHSARAQPASTTIAYPAGWNLIAIPDGSQLSGAYGDLYSWQAGDTDYQRVPPTGPFHVGWGYWTYFPEGGTLELAPGVSTYSETVTGGQWTLVGNPSGAGPVAISGAVSAVVYVPGTGYQGSRTLSTGQGAWAFGSGRISVAPQSESNAPAPIVLPPSGG